MTINIEGIGKITASKEMMNYISLLAREASQKMAENHCFAIAKEARNFADAIYNTLEAKGYYK